MLNIEIEKIIIKLLCQKNKRRNLSHRQSYKRNKAYPVPVFCP